MEIGDLISMKTVSVTGADGFIGSHLTEALVRHGFDVHAFVYCNSFNSWGWSEHCADGIKGKFEVFPEGIKDPYGVKEAMNGCDDVLHRAAIVAIPFPCNSTYKCVDANLRGTLNVLQLAGWSSW